MEKIRNDRKAHTHNRNVICHYPGTTIDFCDFLNSLLTVCVCSLVAQMVKKLPAMWENQVRCLGREDPLEKGMATHSSVLAWRIPWTEEPGRLQSMGSHPTERLTLSLS